MMRDELREAFIRSLARYHGLDHAGHDEVERTSRAYLDSLEKAKPEPPKERTPEEILVRLLDTMREPGALPYELEQALRLVRALREERDAERNTNDHLESDLHRYIGKCNMLTKERDELRRRIEQAVDAHVAYWHGDENCCDLVPTIRRILEGK